MFTSSKQTSLLKELQNCAIELCYVSLVCKTTKLCGDSWRIVAE